MVTIPFTSWLPDMAHLNSPGVTVAKNVIPQPGNTPGQVSYAPMPSAQVYSNSSLPDRINSASIGTDKFSSPHVYAATAAKLWTYKSVDSNWVDVSRPEPYTTSDSETWRWIQFGTSVIGTSFNDVPQWISCDNVDAKFADLTTVVRGRHIAQHKGFVILANCFDSFDGEKPNRVRWSAIDNPFDWTFSQSTMADFNDLQDVGAVQGIVVDEDVWLFCKQSIIRQHFVGSPWVYEFAEVVSGRGCAYPNSLLTVDGISYFLDDDGFYSFKKGSLNPIGNGKVNRFFYSIFDTSSASKMTAVADPRRTIIRWTFASNASNGTPDTTLIYNYTTGDWSLSAAQVPYIFSSMSLAWTIEDLSNTYGAIENVPAPFDSPRWAGGNAILWAVDDQGRILTLTGPSIPGTIETSDYQLGMSDPKRLKDMAWVNAVRPVHQGSGSATVQIAGRGRQTDNLLYSPIATPRPETGYAYCRNRARYHRFRINLMGDWDMASGIDVRFVGAGGR